MPVFENPFTPSFGEIPAHLAGRKQLIADIERALNSPRRRPELTTLLSGARGTGKTTLLSLLSNKAEELGWIAVGVTAMLGMLDDIEIQLRRHARHLIEAERRTTISSIDIASLGGLSFEVDHRTPENWRSRMEVIIEQLNERDIGLLITVDEIDPDLDEMVELSAVYQHFIREGRKVALFMAGLPSNVSTLINNKTVSFLRRAQTERLGRIADYDIEDAFRKTVQENGRIPDEAGLKCAVEKIAGFPFLMQLVGYRAWDASPESQTISFSDFAQGIEIAHREMRDRILDATYRELSPGDVSHACGRGRQPYRRSRRAPRSVVRASRAVPKAPHRGRRHRREGSWRGGLRPPLFQGVPYRATIAPLSGTPRNPDGTRAPPSENESESLQRIASSRSP